MAKSEDEEKRMNELKEEFIDKLEAFLEFIPVKDGERAAFGSHLIFEIMNRASYNYYEALGIVESARDMYKEAFAEITNEDEED